MAKYLDYEGLKHFVGKIKSLVNRKADKSHTHSISDVDNLQTELSGKAEKEHVHQTKEVYKDKYPLEYWLNENYLSVEGFANEVKAAKDLFDKKINFIGQIPFKNAQIIEKGGSTAGIPNETMIYELE